MRNVLRGICNFIASAPSPESPTHANPDFGWDDPKLKFLFDLSDRIERRLAFESSWIGHRMTWLVLSQSFFFAAFAAASWHTEAIPVAVTVVVGIMAPWLVFLARTSILAAREVNNELLRTRGEIDKLIRNYSQDSKLAPLLGLWLELGPTRSHPLETTDERGAQASLWTPRILLSAWICIWILSAVLKLELVSFQKPLLIKAHPVVEVLLRQVPPPELAPRTDIQPHEDKPLPSEPPKPSLPPPTPQPIPRGEGDQTSKGVK